MKLFNYFLIFTVGLGLIGLSSCGTKDVSSIKIEANEIDSMSYAVGLALGSSQIPKDQFPDFDYMVLAKGIADGRDTLEDLITRADGQRLITTYINRIRLEQEEKQKLEDEKFLGPNKEFIAKYEAMPNVKKTVSGLMYEVIAEGSGDKPTVKDQVKVHYTGTLADGTKFDSSVDRGEPSVFSVGGRIIPGWTEGLMLMSPGAKYKFYIPQELGYGRRGSQPVIPPYAPLIFEIELLEVISGNAPRTK